MRSHFGLVVNPVDKVDGLVWAKGQLRTLELAVVREGTGPPAAQFLKSDTSETGPRSERVARSRVKKPL
jgi:hypothetical protein